MSEIEKITSRDNQRLVNARKVRDGNVKNLIFIEGRRLVNEVLLSEMTINECFVVEDFGDRELLKAVAARTEKIAEISERVFRSVADTDNPQGIILIAERPNYTVGDIEECLKSEKSALPIVLFLKEISNPSNLGAILRTAEAAGVSGIVISENSADVYSAKSLRAAMGASFRLKIWENAAFDEVLLLAKNANLIATAADTRASDDYIQIDWKTPRLLIFGSEAHGLSSSELENIDQKIRIPMENEVESLNLAVSAGIILFEAKRQNTAQ